MGTTLVRPIGRNAYRPSGKANWLALAIMSLLTLGVAAVMAVVLAVVYWNGFYIIGLAPFFAAAPLAGMTYATVVLSHCRNRAAPILLGALSAAILYFGYYHVDMISAFGVQNAQRVAHRVDALPSYIKMRMTTDIIQDVGRDNQQPNQGPDRGKIFFNWMFFCMDLAIIGGMAIVPAFLQAAKPYSEQQKAWMKSVPLPLTSGRAAAVVEALQSRNVQGLSDLLSEPAAAMHAGYCELAVYYPPGSGAAAGSKPLISVAELGKADSQTGARPRRELARLWELFDDEYAAIAARNAAVATAAASSLPAEALVTTPQNRLVAEDAFIDDVPAENHGKVLSPSHLWIGAGICVAPLLVLFVLGIVLLSLAAWWSNASVAVSTTMGVSGIAVLIVAALWGLWFSDLLPSRWLYGLLRNQIAMRPDAIVRPDNERAEFIQVIPREHWGKVMLDNASDVGLLVADHQRRMVLFEGDKQRWAVPAGSIVSCEVEHFVVGAGEGTQTFYLAVLRAQNGGQIWEGCINRRHIKFARRGSKQVLRDAEDLRRQILALRSSST